MMLSVNILVCHCMHAPSPSLPKSTWNRGWKPFWITRKDSADCSETEGVTSNLPTVSPWIRSRHYEMVAGPWPQTRLQPLSYLLHLPLRFFLDHSRSEACGIFVSHLGPWRHRQCLKTTELQCDVKDHRLGRCSGYVKTGKAGVRALKPKFKFHLTAFAFLSSPHACFFFSCYMRWL